MRLDWKDILTGWRNDLFPPKELKELIRKTQEERLNVCLNCPFNSTKGKINNFSYCTDCKCPLKKKAACLHCQCPKEYWLAVAEPEESKQIQETIKNQDDEPSNT